ncbi:Branched-chain amino acid aminotransferase [Clostridiaceae bacterium JG1575]|nr:Branched-chain amino acid aminotransferase [Clostridiaceae bacterium JG1575]
MDLIMYNGEWTHSIRHPLPQGPGIAYEVLRIIDGTPLYLKEHHARLMRSLMSRQSFVDFSLMDYAKACELWVLALQENNFNLKTLVDPATLDVWHVQSPASYPTLQQYEQGVKTLTYSYERQDPNAKILNPTLTNSAAQIRKKEGVYELLLVDATDHITEGARSNVFFFKDGALYTPPADEVLPGVTRARILTVAEREGLEVFERPIERKELPHMEGAFLSGTSPKILPICQVDELFYDVTAAPLLRRLMDAFDQDIQEDLLAQRSLATKKGTRE